MAVLTPVGRIAALDPAGADRPPQSLLHSALASVALSLWGGVLGFVSVPVMVSRLGLADYGVYSLAFTLASYGAFLELGFTWAGMKSVAEAHAARDREGVRAVLWALLLYQALVGGVVIAVIGGSADLLGRWLAPGASGEAARIAAVLPFAAVWFLLSGLVGVLIAVLRGLCRYVAAALVGGLALTIGVGGGVVAVLAGGGLGGAVALQLVAAVVAGLAGAVTVGGQLLAPPSAGVIASAVLQLRRLLAFSLWSVASRVVQVAVLQGDKVLAAKAVGAVGLPFYVVPFNVAQKLNVVGAAAVTAVYPVAAGASGTRAEFLESYLRAARVVHVVTAAPAIALLVWAPLFLHSWIGLEMSTHAAGYLRALGLGYWIVSVCSVEAGCLEGWGHPRLTALASAAGLAAAIGVGVVGAALGGMLWGVTTGVTAWMAVTGVTQLLAWLRVSAFPVARLWRHVLRPIVEMATIGVLIAEVSAGWMAPGPVGLLACGALAALLLGYGVVRVFSSAERQALRARLVGLVAT